MIKRWIQKIKNKIIMDQKRYVGRVKIESQILYTGEGGISSTPIHPSSWNGCSELQYFSPSLFCYQHRNKLPAPSICDLAGRHRRLPTTRRRATLGRVLEQRDTEESSSSSFRVADAFGSPHAGEGAAGGAPSPPAMCAVFARTRRTREREERLQQK
uniref:Uncharacterized protein n=1 Tax=Oryza brachyantha TaxID=4533 RepID=J3MSQ0_ORYBR